jgi:hypothetical protein
MEQLGAQQRWDALVETFLIDLLQGPRDEVTSLQQSPEWTTWTADAQVARRCLRAAYHQRQSSPCSNRLQRLPAKHSGSALTPYRAK